ncbi:ESPR-type extended signal peptide-containing protein, partial [Mannheimia haemolytica]|uniref:ESPR-type extended signal peptide-containing protein n=1 Tax=Mannheimia haemolytica TaxID=75985 RepID=UPI00246959D8
MNKIFKVIFNQTTQKMEVVSELARSQGKAASSTDKRGTIKLAAASILGGATLISGMAAFMLSATPAEAAVIIDRIENENKNNGAVVNKIVIHTNASVPTNFTTNPYNYFNPGSLSYADRTKPQASGKPNKNGTDSRLLYNSNTTSAIVIGHHATAVEDVTVTQGKKAKASGVAIGDYSHAGGALSIAIGPFSRTASIGSVALGTSARADGFNSFAAMRQSAAIADYSIAIGSSSWANATASFAMGASATALGDRSFAIGSGTPKTVDGSRGKENRRSIYDGQNNTLAFGTDAFSIGTKAKTNGNRSFAIGTNAWSGGFKLEKHATINELGSVFNPDTAKVANNAFALGTNTRANSNDTVAFSTNANATGDGSIAFGVNSNTKGTGAIAFGNASKAWKANAISIGWNATSHAEKVISIGSHSNARKHGAMAIGDTANSSGNHSVAIGYSANVSNANATAVGTRANITHKGGTAIGFEAESKGNYATAIAYNSTASGKNSIAAGVNSNVSGTRAAALGYNNTVSELGKDTFVLGSNVTVKTAGSVILGSDSTEATATTEDTATVGTLTYSGFAGDENVVAGDYVSVGNATNARQIKFVAPGKIASNSTDAINGSQLYAVADTLVKTGFNITADHSGLEYDAKKEDNVKLGETVKYTSTDKNVVTTVTNNAIDFGLSDNISVGGKQGKDGSIGVKGADGTVGVTLNGKDGSIG